MVILICSICGGQVAERVLSVMPAVHILRCEKCGAEKTRKGRVVRRVVQMPKVIYSEPPEKQAEAPREEPRRGKGGEDGAPPVDAGTLPHPA